ncbi:MAG: hemolysin III family protein [SAR324 cluster bacterium]
MTDRMQTLAPDEARIPAFERRATRQRIAEDLASSITGGLGWVASTGGLAVLVAFASVFSNAWEVVACSVYGATLILAYSATTLYHAVSWPPAKRVFRIMDHCTIYLLIAGTYTPFALGPLRGPWGWSLFGAAWGLAVLGIAFKIVFRALARGTSSTAGTRYELLTVLVYLGMGWMGVVAIVPILQLVPGPGRLFLLIGGLAYTAGIAFYITDHKLLFGHAIWHLFVLTGSSFHYFAILFWVILWP